MTTPEVRGADRVDELLEAVRRAGVPDDLSVDELLTACHERGGTVLALEHVGVVALAVGRGPSGDLVASVRLVVAEPEAAVDDPLDVLLTVAEDWARERAADRIVLHGDLPFALWPGVVVDSPLVAVTAARGWESGAAWDSYRVPVGFRSDPPPGVTVRRAVHDDDVARVLVAASASWPRRSDEIARALEHGTCHVAVGQCDGDTVVLGVATHSIARAGWVGPLVVVDEARRRGVGHALLGQVCRDLMIAEFPHLIVGDASDDVVRSFVEAAGAEPDVRWVRVERRLDR